MLDANWGKNTSCLSSQGSFNFYLSQLRILVKMSFGFLFGNECSLKNSYRIIVGAMKLHNFVLKDVIKNSRDG
jgi:hypothetical protein